MITYNHEKFIAQAVESALMQKTLFDYEIIIGDDCSTDKTTDILTEYSRRHKDRITYIKSKMNVGVTSNFIKTLNACKGEYIAILEGDDYWTSPQKIQKQVDFLDTHADYSMCFTNGSIVDDNSHEIQNERLAIDRKRNLRQKDIIEGLLPPSNTVVFRRNALQAIPDVFFNIVNGDYLLFSLLTENHDAAYLDENTACYRMHKGGSWSQQTDLYRANQYVKTILALLSIHGNKYRTTLLNKLKNGYANIAELERKEKDRFAENRL